VSKKSGRHPRRLSPIRSAIMLAGAAAVITGGAFMLAPSSGTHNAGKPAAAPVGAMKGQGVARGQHVDFASDCAAIDDAITNHQSFDGTAAEECERSEDGNSAQPSQVGETCQLALQRAITGDLDMPAGFLLFCRSAEVGSRDGQGIPSEPDSLCTGAAIAVNNGQKIDPEIGITCFQQPTPQPPLNPQNPFPRSPSPSPTQ
jgi:hypothetical protein